MRNGEKLADSLEANITVSKSKVDFNKSKYCCGVNINGLWKKQLTREFKEQLAIVQVEQSDDLNRPHLKKRFAIIGGGWYGSHIALAIKKVILLQK